MNKDNLSYKTNKYTYNFSQFETIRSFSRNIYIRTITPDEADKDPSYILIEILSFKERARPRNLEKTQQKINTLESLHKAFEGRDAFLEKFLMLLYAEYFHYHQTKGHGVIQT